MGTIITVVLIIIAIIVVGVGIVTAVYNKAEQLSNDLQARISLDRLLDTFVKCYTDPSKMQEADWVAYEKALSNELSSEQWEILTAEFNYAIKPKILLPPPPKPATDEIITAIKSDEKHDRLERWMDEWQGKVGRPAEEVKPTTTWSVGALETFDQYQLRIGQQIATDFAHDFIKRKSGYEQITKSNSSPDPYEIYMQSWEKMEKFYDERTSTQSTSATNATSGCRC